MFSIIAISFRKIMSWIVFILASIGFLATDTTDSTSTEPIRIGAFNIQIFGKNKLSDKKVFNSLMTIVSRYDIVLIQEIRDNTNDAIQKFTTELNKRAGKSARKSPDAYAYVISPRLGRTVSKEQYAFVYRPDRVSIKDSYVFDDGDELTGEDLFQREPFIVKVHSPTSMLTNFALIGIHTQPDDAIKEIKNLAASVEDVKKKWNMENAIILGDFNAGCGYVPKKAWRDIPLYTDTKQFTWLFDHTIDTTTGASKCPYDRMVVVGTRMKHAILPNSANIFYFDKELNLSEEETLAISDHYPIEVQLKVKSSRRNTKV